MNSASGESAPATPPDDYAAAIDKLHEAPPPPPANAVPEAPPEAPRQYPPFHPDEYRDNPFASGINGLADTLAKMPDGSATKDNLGESIVYAFECYSGTNTGNLPPYMHVVLSAGKYTVRVVVEKKNQRAPTPETRQERADDLAQQLAAAGAPINKTEKT